MAKTTAEKILIMQAFEEGKEIEFTTYYGIHFSQSALKGDTNLVWNWEECDYRIKPQPAPIPMTIPWEAIDEKWQWAAMDKNGNIFFYESQPKRLHNQWGQGDDFCRSTLIKINTGTVSWENSLQQRPQA